MGNAEWWVWKCSDCERANAIMATGGGEPDVVDEGSGWVFCNNCSERELVDVHPLSQ